MAITVPVVQTALSVAAFGKPVVDEINRITPITTIVPWAAVTFTNGYANTGSGFAPVMYRKAGDIVYLRGEMNSPNSGNLSVPAFALPAGFRPPAYLEFGTGVYSSVTLNYISIGIRVNTDGTVVPFWSGAVTTLSIPLNQIFLSVTA